MRVSTVFLVAFSFAVALASLPGWALAFDASNAGIQTASVQRIATPRVTPAPLGFQIFCMRTPEYCAASASAQVEMSANLMAVLNQVNSSVNHSIRPRPRGAEIWELGARYGDCKDYAMNKRAELIRRGVPPGALRLAIGYTSWGEGHAVLVVRTSAGDLVLDNLINEIKHWNETGHRLTAISSSDPRKWQVVS